MAKSKKLAFNEWVEEVDELIGDRYDTSIRDLEDDVSADFLRESYDDGMSPNAFVRREIEPLFDEDED